MKKMTKSAKVRRYFEQHPNAIPKDVGAKFACAMPVVYAIRKQMMADATPEATPVAVKPFVPSNKADHLQVGGDHYHNMGVQPWVAMESWMTKEQFLGFLRGNALKYLARCDAKGKLEDVKKAHHYLAKYIEVAGD